jgi:hypothetical protein
VERGEWAGAVGKLGVADRLGPREADQDREHSLPRHRVECHDRSPYQFINLSRMTIGPESPYYPGFFIPGLLAQPTTRTSCAPTVVLRSEQLLAILRCESDVVVRAPRRYSAPETSPARHHPCGSDVEAEAMRKRCRSRLRPHLGGRRAAGRQREAQRARQPVRRFR